MLGFVCFCLGFVVCFCLLFLALGLFAVVVLLKKKKMISVFDAAGLSDCGRDVRPAVGGGVGGLDCTCSMLLTVTSRRWGGGGGRRGLGDGIWSNMT